MVEQGTASSDATAAFAAYQDTKFFRNLNGLRFICIAMVLWHHAPPVDMEMVQLFGRGFLGVDFFFVLSGYLITTLLLREARDHGRFSIRDFYIRRILRIVPVYVFVVSCVAAYYILVQGQTQYLQLLPYYYLFLSNFLTEHIPTLAITWSLSVEEQFYLIWPALLLFLPRRFWVPLLVLLIGVNVLLSGGWIPYEPAAIGPLLFKLPNATYAPILMGALLAIVLHHPHGFAVAWRAVGQFYASLLLLVGLVLVLQLTPANVLGWPNLLIHSTMMLLLTALVVRGATVLTPFLESRVIARVGEISYGVYLYHLLALDVWMRTAGKMGFDAGWIKLFGYSVLSIVIAEISFRTLEAFFRRFRPGGPPAAAQARA